MTSVGAGATRKGKCVTKRGNSRRRVRMMRVRDDRGGGRGKVFAATTIFALSSLFVVFSHSLSNSYIFLFHPCSRSFLLRFLFSFCTIPLRSFICFLFSFFICYVFSRSFLFSTYYLLSIYRLFRVLKIFFIKNDLKVYLLIFNN